MSKKAIIKNLQVKLHRLKELEKSKTYGCNTLNQYTNDLSGYLQELKITSMALPKILDHYKHSAIGGGPSTTETSILNELINKYSELLTTLNPNNSQSIISEIKETSGKLKLINVVINLAIVVSSSALFYNIGKDTNNGIKETLQNRTESQKDSINKQSNIIRSIQLKSDSLSNELNRNNKFIKIYKIETDSLVSVIKKINK